MTKESPQRTKIIVELGFEAGVKGAVASMFRAGKGDPSLKAIREMLDNIGDARNRDGHHTTEALVEHGKDVLSNSDALIIVGWRETGAGETELKKLLSGGGSISRDIKSKIGLGGLGGGEAAPWFLGTGLRVGTHKEGETEQFIFDDPTYGNPTVAHEGGREVVVRPVERHERDIGKVVTTIYGLKEKIPGAAAMRKEFGKVFRPLLVPGDTKVSAFRMDPNRQLEGIPGRQVVTEKGTIELVHDRMLIWVKGHKKGTERVVPEQIPLQEGYSEELKVTWTVNESTGRTISPLGYWFGEIDRSVPGAKNADPGFTVYYDGRRVMSNAWFGLDERQPALSNLVGEVDASQEDLKAAMSVSKAHDVSLEHSVWKRIERAMHDVLAPVAVALIEKGRSEEVQQFLISAAELQRARYFVDAAIASVLAQDEIGEALVGFSTIVGRGGGSTQGQLPPAREGTHEKTTRPKPVGIKGKDWEDQAGRTLRQPGTNVAIPRKRAGFAARFRFKDFSAGDNRSSEIIHEESEPGKLERVLEVNTLHPDWRRLQKLKATDQHLGDIEDVMYLCNEAGARAAEMYSDDPKERKQFAEDVRWKVGEFVNQHPSWSLVNPESKARRSK